MGATYWKPAGPVASWWDVGSANAGAGCELDSSIFGRCVCVLALVE